LNNNNNLPRYIKKERSMKSKRFFIFILLLTVLIPGTFSFGQSLATKKEIQKLVQAMQIIELAYVDSVDLKDVVANTIEQALKELDPHSAYLSKEELQKSNEQLEGSFDGIGVTFQIYQDTILVISPVPGGPSEKLGILSGDKIVKIDGEEATGEDIDNEWVMNHLRGKRGTTVDVSIYRGKKDLLEFTIIRDKIPLNSIDASFMASPTIGYIRLNRFSKTSREEFDTSVATLKSLGMKKLILDLRGNAGGYLNTAYELADEFISSGKLVVYTEGLHSPRKDFYATAEGNFEKGNLVIIIDEASASASEIVAGAVQDLDRGIVIGRRSFGKGLVQGPFDLPDGSVIRLTTARYYTPTGRCIQRSYDKGTEAYYEDFVERFDHGEYVNADSIKFPDSLKYETPAGRVVYGGGGIMPDIFIPWDSTMFSDYFVELRRKNVLNTYTLQYVEKNRERLNLQFPTFSSFKTGFKVTPEIIKEFKEYAEKDSIKFDEEGWKASEPLILTQIKALIARNLWDTNALYEIMSDIDPEYHRAIEMLEDEQVFRILKVG
jgi:carboxyl-terminal processing protease